MIPIRDTLPRRNKPIATYLLILINAIVFLFELTMPPPELAQVINMFGLVPARFMHPDWASSAGYPGHTYWPFLTSMFLHGGWLHIIGNMWTLWIFGDNIEDQMGPARYVIFYLLCGLTAGIVVLVPIFFFPFFFEVPAFIYLGFWALSQVFSGTLALASGMQVGGVAFWAHVGGFVAGIVLQFFFVRRGPAYRPLPRDQHGVAAAWPPYRYGRQFQ